MSEEKLKQMLVEQAKRIEEISALQVQLLAMIAANTTIATALVKMDGGTDPLIAALAYQSLRTESLLLNFSTGDVLVESYQDFLRGSLPPDVHERLQNHQLWPVAQKAA
ncbi:hypothetical protein COAQ111491_21555 [Comamonas aquatilis]|uniref:hypothetical protein n=1 Tax=Comamonas aquatilis TaxID=1778406 RepID=UPI0039EE968C